ncbi:uncharacterized protein LDX57_005723 [Aspergillus melleus]|uniref:uncharacterized protein n=1 Tax=Aspergillus melleus TaxID=138277 RepID=UPI001E8CE6F3|nr:uncharacterized protein LDX57_005723 [Aspergillus melleus]KAH8428018.1 hypothetical protein LDX57_005723 [Aspergillus melleus]
MRLRCVDGQLNALSCDGEETREMEKERDGKGRVTITWRTRFNVPVDREVILDKDIAVFLLPTRRSILHTSTQAHVGRRSRRLSSHRKAEAGFLAEIERSSLRSSPEVQLLYGDHSLPASHLLSLSLSISLSLSVTN